MKNGFCIKKLAVIITTIILVIGTAPLNLMAQAVSSASLTKTARIINIFQISGEDATIFNRAGGQSRTPRAGQRINNGNVIITGNDTSIYLQLDNTSIVRISEHSEVSVGFVGGRLSLAVQSGNPLSEVQQAAISSQVVGGNLMVGVRGDTWFDMMSHAVVITEDGALWVWGSNDFGQIGDGTTVYRLNPVRIMENVAAAVAGATYTLAITYEGVLWAWGSHPYSPISSNIPTRIRDNVDGFDTFETWDMYEAWDYGAGWASADFFIDEFGLLWGMGFNWTGQLGDGTTQDRDEWVQIMGNVSSVYPIRGTHTFAITNDSSLWAWGENRSGNLGDGTTVNRYSPVRIMDNVAELFAFGDCIFDSVHAFALTTYGSVYAWGPNWFGQLGDGTTTNRYSPVHIIGNIDFIYVGSYRSLAVDNNGVLWEWGASRNNPEQIKSGIRAMSLSSGNVYNPPWRYSPVRNMDNVVYASSGGCSVLAITADGVLWAWGNNWTGQLGDGTTEHRYFPVQVMEDVFAVSTASQTGSGHTLAITSDGVLWTWGWNGLSLNLYPVRVMDDAIAASAGPGFSMAITSDGVLWAWGVNLSGQLGDGTTINRYYPTPIMENIRDVATGFYQTWALTNDGDLWTWGGYLGEYWMDCWYDWEGELFCFDDTFHRPYPVRVMGNVASIAAGYAITYEGTLFRINDPLLLLENVRSVYAGLDGGSGMAITDDNVLWALGWCWIWYDAGMLHDFDTNFPVPIAENVSAVFLGVSQAIIVPDAW